MNSTIKNPNKRTLYFILPFIVVLLSSTFAFGQPFTKFPINITSTAETTSGDVTLQNFTINFSGRNDVGFSNDSPPGPDANGCYVSFSGDDGTTICIDQVSLLSAISKKQRSSAPMRVVGTGTIMIPIGGNVNSGIAYIDVKGTWRFDPFGLASLTFNGKIGGGGQDFVFTASFRTVFDYTQ